MLFRLPRKKESLENLPYRAERAGPFENTFMTLEEKKKDIFETVDDNMAHRPFILKMFIECLRENGTNYMSYRTALRKMKEKQGKLFKDD